MSLVIGNGNGIPFQNINSDLIPEVCFLITELGDFCVQEIDASSSGRMIPETCP